MKRGTVRRAYLLVLWVTLVATAACTARDAGEGGSLVVVLQRASEAAWMDGETEVLVQLSPGGAVAAWTPQSPAVFTGLRPGRRYQIHLPARFLAEPRSATALADRPVNIVMGVLTFSSLGDLLVRGEHRHQAKALYLDTTVAPERWRLEWRQGHHIVTRRMIPGDPEALTEVLGTEWKIHGNHHDPADLHRDQAVVVVDEGAGLAEVVPVVAAITPIRRAFRRERYRFRGSVRDAEDNRPVFSVRLAHPRHVVPPPPPPEPPSSDYDGPAPSLRAEITQQNSGLSLAEARAIIDQVQPRLRRCYEHGLVTDPRLEGVHHVRSAIGVDGRGILSES